MVMLNIIRYVHLNHVGLCCWGLGIHLNGSFEIMLSCEGVQIVKGKICQWAYGTSHYICQIPRSM
jgi:hypothetical protein